MARAIWSGSISFGLVNVPVKAYAAVRDHKVHFNQLERKTGARIRYQKVSDKTGKEVEADDIELGYEVARDSYVTIEQDELDALRPKSTPSIGVADFVDLADIDPIYYERTYWLAPDGEPAERAYRLLLAAMQDSARAGIGSVVMRNKQYLAAIRPLDGALAMSTMRFGDEVVPKSSIDQIPAGAKADVKELRLATQIIDSLVVEWDPSRYHDTYTEELQGLLERKAKGEKIVIEESPAARANVTNLMSALEASIAAAKKARGGDASKEMERAAEKLITESDDGVARTAKKAAPKRKVAAAEKPAAAKKPVVAKTPTAAKKPARKAAARKSA